MTTRDRIVQVSEVSFVHILFHYGAWCSRKQGSTHKACPGLSNGRSTGSGNCRSVSAPRTGGSDGQPARPVPLVAGGGCHTAEGARQTGAPVPVLCGSQGRALDDREQERRRSCLPASSPSYRKTVSCTILWTCELTDGLQLAGRSGQRRLSACRRGHAGFTRSLAARSLLPDGRSSGVSMVDNKRMSFLTFQTRARREPFCPMPADR